MSEYFFMPNNMNHVVEFGKRYPHLGVCEYSTYLLERQTPADTRALLNIGNLAKTGQLAPFTEPLLRDAMDLAKLRAHLNATPEGREILRAYSEKTRRDDCNRLRAHAIIALDDALEEIRSQ